MQLINTLNSGLEKLEGFVLSLTILFMIALAFLQVILRDFFSTGLSWADPVVRALVVWVGFIGASIAAHQKGHISFDVLSKFLPPLLKKISQLVVHFGSSAVCLLLANAAYKFVMMEKEFGSMLVAKIPFWWAIIIIPVSFVIMAARFFLHGIGDLVGFFKKEPEKQPE